MSGQEKPEPRTERWYYAGRRMAGSQATKLVDAWFVPDRTGAEQILWFSHIRRLSIGGLYEVRVVRDDGRVTLHGSPSFVEFSASDPRVVEDRERWLAEDSAAVVARELRLSEKRAIADEGKDFGDMTLREVRSRLGALLAHQRRGFLAHVLLYLSER